jgi:hypothetical protein
MSADGRDDPVMWRRHSRNPAQPVPVADDFCDLVAGQPFVVERPHGLSATVRMFDVECEPLHQRATWLMVDCVRSTSGRPPTSLTAILPRRAARKVVRRGPGRCSEPGRLDRIVFRLELADRVVYKLDPLAPRRHVEAVVLAAYASAISWGPRPTCARDASSD